jgi:iron complex outermembrane recepter protein
VSFNNVFVLAVFIFPIVPGVLLAADQPEAIVADSTGGLEEVVVTARRVSERLQSTPVSIQAFTDKDLLEKNIQSTQDLQLVTPGVYLGSDGAKGNVNYTIRGQSKALAGPSSPGVVSYYSDTPDPVFGSAVPEYDIKSIQVLKGPQGTLFGRNTIGGAVLVYPTAPGYDHDGYVNVQYGNFDYEDVQAAVDVPIVDQKLTVRLAGEIKRRQSYVTDLGGFANTDNIDSNAFRMLVRVDPTENLKSLLTLDYYINDTAGAGIVPIGLSTTPGAADLLGLRSAMQQYLALQNSRGPRIIESSFPNWDNVKRMSAIDRTDWSIGSFDIANIVGFRRTHWSYAGNADGLPVLTTDGTGPAVPIAGVPFNYIKASDEDNTQQFTEEFQLHGKALDDKLTWLGGLFYLDNHPDGPQGNMVGFGVVEGSPYPDSNYFFTHEQSRAVFTHETYDLGSLIPGLKFSVGVRYTKDTVSSCTGSGSSAAIDAQPESCVVGSTSVTNAARTNANSHAPTWDVGPEWQITPDIFTYLVTRRGYRAGGVNGPSLALRLAPFQTFEPETVTDVELGMRSDWKLANVLFRFNASVFTGKYKNTQAALTGLVTTPSLCNPASKNNPPGISPDGDCIVSNDPAGGTLLANIATTTVKGVDIDGIVQFTPHLTFNYSANFLTPKTDSLNVPPALANYATSGIEFNNVAKRTFASGIRYEVPLPDNLGELMLNGDAYWSSPIIYGPILLPSYSVLNAVIDWNDVGGTRGLSVGLWGKNLADRVYIEGGTISGGATTIIAGWPGAPRTFGASVRYSW